MSKRIDLTNRVFGKLTVIKFLRCQNTHAIWKAICSCGKTLEIQSGNLISGNTNSCQSCGNSTHGKSKNRLYRRWKALKERGILSAEWENCSTFIDDISSTFQEGYSLRRLNTSLPHSFDNSYWVKPRTTGLRLSERVYFKKKIKVVVAVDNEHNTHS